MRHSNMGAKARHTAALAGIALLAACSDVVDADLVIRAGTVIDGTGRSPRVADVFVRDGRITLVAPPGRRTTAGAEEVDARGRYLIPGLVDGHVHFSLGAPMARRADETEEVLRRLVHYGVTSILQMGATGGGTDSIVALRTRQAAGHLSPTVYASGGHLTPLGSHPVATLFSAEVNSRVDSMAAVTPVERPIDLDGMGIGISVVRGPEAVAEAVRRRADSSMDFIKITIESGPTPFGDDHPQMSLETTREVVRQAAARGLPVLAHVSSLDELETAFEGGASGIVHAVQNVPLPDSLLAIRMAERGFYVMPTLVLYADPELTDAYLAESVTQDEISALANPGFLARFGRLDCCAPLASVLANISMLHRTGVPIVLGTDTGNPFVFPGYSVHKELELLVAAGLPPASALQAGTIRVAEMLGRAEEFGTLEEGKRADILILGADPLVDVRNSRSIEVVVLRGRVVRPAAVGVAGPG
jgi:imidazolonepropionase-like amidohydrolase